MNPWQRMSDEDKEKTLRYTSEALEDEEFFKEHIERLRESSVKRENARLRAISDMVVEAVHDNAFLEKHIRELIASHSKRDDNASSQ